MNDNSCGGSDAGVARRVGTYGRVFISAGGAAMFIFKRSLAGPLVAAVLLALLVVLDALFGVGVP